MTHHTHIPALLIDVPPKIWRPRPVNINEECRDAGVVSHGWVGGLGDRQGQRCPGLSQVINRASDGSGSGAGDGVAGGLRLLLSGKCRGKAGTVAGDGVHGCNRVVREGDTAVGRSGSGGGMRIGGSRNDLKKTIFVWTKCTPHEYSSVHAVIIRGGCGGECGI